MKTKDSLTEHYMPLLERSYDCIDRIVLNAYCPMLLRAGGIRNLYRIMEGSDEGLSDATLMRYAGRFSRRVQAFCQQRGIPLIYFKSGERKHEEAESYDLRSNHSREFLPSLYHGHPVFYGK